jgi:hypothetical protein
MVNYLTCVVLDLDYTKESRFGAAAIEPRAIRDLGRYIEDRLQRIAAMTELLSAKGFTVQRQKHQLFAYSDEIEAQETKHWLRAHGFEDCEFQIRLEYTRQWGIL